MKSLPFEPPSALVAAFAYELESGGSGRWVDVFVWDDRLLAFEKERGLWWCTLDGRGECDVREFWKECVRNGRVGRIGSAQSGFRWLKSPGAILQVDSDFFYYVVVGQDNGGIGRLQNQTVWHSFAGGNRQGARATQARKPTIWSPGFHARFGLRRFAALGLVSEEDVLKDLPDSLHLLWAQGANAVALRLVAAALALGWARGLRAKLGMSVNFASFWNVVLENRVRLRGNVASPLPGALLQSSEIALPGQLVRLYQADFNEPRPAAFLWHCSRARLQVDFGNPSPSMHERLEHRLVLRDWLVQFFPQDEVESWFDV